MDDNELNTDSSSSSVSVSLRATLRILATKPRQNQGEPLASIEGSSDEEQKDLEGLTRVILEKRYERRIPVQTWYVLKKTMLTFLVSENR